MNETAGGGVLKGFVELIRATAELVKSFFDGYGVFEFAITLVVCLGVFWFVNKAFFPDENLFAELGDVVRDIVTPIVGTEGT